MLTRKNRSQLGVDGFTDDQIALSGGIIKHALGSLGPGGAWNQKIHQDIRVDC